MLPLELNNLDSFDLALGKQIYRLNQLINFPYSDEIIESIVKSLKKLVPNITEQELEIVIDNYFLGKSIYKKENGVTKIIKDIETLRQKTKYSDNQW